MERNKPKFRLLSISKVQLTKHHDLSNDKVELTPFDLYFLSALSPQIGLLFHKPSASQRKEFKDNSVIDHLKVSFARALESFPPLAGRLEIVKNEDRKSSFFIDCNNTGALFVHTMIDNVTIKDILEPIYVPRIVQSFFPTEGLRNYEGVYRPLLVGQVTELIDGFFIGCTMNHAVVDGENFKQFFDTWSNLSSGLDNITMSPCLKRSILNISNHPLPINSLFSKRLDDNIVLPPLQQAVFYFKKDKIAEIKRKANSEVSTTKISSIQALYAHLWQSVVRSLCFEDMKQDVTILFPVDSRSRLKPPLPKGYFGNTIYPVCISASVGELLAKGLGQVAWQLNQKIAKQTDSEIRTFLGNWMKRPTRMDVKGNVFTVTNSPRFNYYDNDFGWGKPLEIGYGLSYAFNGHIVVSHGPEKESIEVSIFLEPKTLDTLMKDEKLMKYVDAKPFHQINSFSSTRPSPKL